MSKRKNPQCPVNGWDCPHWCEDGSCALGDEETMMSECDDAYYVLGFFGEDEEE